MTQVITEHAIAVIGGGPAGMAAAVAAYDSGVEDVVILDREERLGGILKQCIHNGFGLHKLGRELTGPEYAAVYEEKVKERGIRVYRDAMVTALSPDRVITVRSMAGMQRIRAQAVILAMGCRERPRGALNIPGTRPAGVYSAGTAQKLMNREGIVIGNRAVILGSGDIGMIMARRLTLEGAKVEAVCELLPYSGGLERNRVQCLQDFGIPLYLSTTVIAVHGAERVTGVTVAQVDEQRRVIEGTQREIPCDTLLLSVGLIPENELTRGIGLAMDPVTGGARVDERRQTEAAGIFACGNVLQVHDLVDYVSEEAELAGRGAAAYVKRELTEGPTIATQAGDGVRYVLPQRLHRAAETETTLFWRVTRPYGRVRYTVRAGETVLATAVRPKASPGEMERLTLKAEQILSAGDGPITLSLEELS